MTDNGTISEVILKLNRGYLGGSSGYSRWLIELFVVVGRNSST